MNEVFLIVDGNSLMYRAFHALPLLNVGDKYTNAIHGFFMMLLKAIQEENVQYLAITFDEHAPTFRHVEYADYKAGRKPMPPELVQQMATIRELLTKIGIKWYSFAGWEGDDIMGTLAKHGEEDGMLPLLLTGDRDALQLVDEKTTMLYTKKGITETVHFTPEMVMEVYGIMPSQVTDWKGLMGDKSDNLPGIPGVGETTAKKLMDKYGGTIEEILANADKIPGALGEKVRAYGENAKITRHLATIRRDAPVTWDREALRLPDLSKGIPSLKELHLSQVVRKITDMYSAKEIPEDDDSVRLMEFPESISCASAEDVVNWVKSLHKNCIISISLKNDALSAAAIDEKGKAAGTAQCRVSEGFLGVDMAQAANAAAKIACITPCVVHDGKALLHTMDKYGAKPLPENFLWDTMLGAYLLNPQEKSYAISELFPDFPDDASTVASLYVDQRKKIDTEGMLPLMKDVEMPLSFVLFDMEKSGFKVDKQFLEKLGNKYTEELRDLENQIYEACGVGTFSINSPIQLSEVLFEKCGLPHGKKTSRGYSTAVDVLEGLRDYAPEIIEPLLRYRQLSKLNSTYVAGMLPLLDSQGRIHSTFNQTVTATGRLSSSEPNLQNIPVRTDEGEALRHAFVAQEGWVLLDADYSQIELRLMAHLSGDATMVEAFREGKDIHAITASEIFEVPLESVTHQLRSRAKAVNFGLIYGISEYGLAKNTGVTPFEARNFIKRYFVKYPDVKNYMDEAVSKGTEIGYATTLMGRRRYLPELQSDKNQVREFGKRAAMNTPLQGTAADIIKVAMVRVYQELKKRKMRSRLILQVHDELIIEAPPEEAQEAGKLLKECMENVIELKVPLTVEINSGCDWGDAK